MDPVVRAEQIGPMRVFAAWLPWPDWDKNDRLVPNAVRREKGGKLYFKEGEGMWKRSAAARAYRLRVQAVVLPALPCAPWFVALPWEAYLTQVRPEGARADVDHHAGVMDDLIACGLAESDRHCRALHLDAETAPGEGGLWWFSRQRQT